MFEIRLQLALVGVFLVGCVLAALSEKKLNDVWAGAVRNANWLFALITVFLVSNYLVCMCALEYGAEVGAIYNASSFFTSMDSIRGSSMDWYDPEYGFFIFQFCLLALAWISLRRRAKVA